MCPTIEVVLPVDADVGKVAELSDAHKVARGLVVTRGQHGSTVTYELEPRGMCFCDIDLGFLRERRARLDSHAAQSDIAKLRKKSSGEAKIARWVYEKQKVADAAVARHERLEAHLADATEVGGWLPFVRSVVETGAALSIGLAHHENDDPLLSGPRIAIADLTPLVLYETEENVVYTFA